MRTRSCRTFQFYFGPSMCLLTARISVPIKRRKLLKRGPLAPLILHLKKSISAMAFLLFLKQSEKLLKTIKYVSTEYYFLRPLNVYLSFLSFLFHNIIERQECIIPTARKSNWMYRSVLNFQSFQSVGPDLKPETGSLCWPSLSSGAFYPPTRSRLIGVEDVACLFTALGKEPLSSFPPFTS